MKHAPLTALLLLATSQVFAEGTPGFILIPAQGGMMGGGGAGSTLVDPKGTTVKSFSVAGYNSYLLPNGHILGQTGNGSAAAMGFASLVEQAAGSATAINTWTASGGSFHHAHWVMPNGHWLGTYTVKINPKNVLPGFTGSLTSIWDERIQEWDPVAKKIVWEWKASDHTSPTNHPRKFNNNLFKSQDPLHINSVVYDSARDLVVMSSHYLYEVLVIDHSTTTAQAATSSGGKYGKGGDLLFRWGCTKNYGGTGAAVSDVVHGGGVIQAGLPGAGNFSLFGNSDNTVKQSRWYEVKGQESDTGWVIGSNGEFVASLVFDFYNSSYQSTGHYGYGQRLANGNTLITYSGSQKLVEVTPAKAVVNVLTGNTIRAFHYPPNHPAIVSLGLGSSGVERTMSNGVGIRASWGQILATGLVAGSRLRVLDAQGVIRYESIATSEQASIPAVNWANGAYVLQVLQNGKSSSQTIALTR
ncbi:MAG: aryl-sulfate sulfotransferase [Fibrobacterota bacterium]|nr:aryl-sulfate sulfotransferase [Fibrobacterota bacterium]QQS04819.1 MAG: aryl-sulfate sulfotransferase [Fibrobacterota bacterium]